MTDLRSLLLATVQARGFSTITAFVDARPTASLRQLADDLHADGRAPALSPDAWESQLAALWREDAEQIGAAGIERMARRLLVGELAAAIPAGWRARWTDTHDARAAASKLSTALSQWGAYLGPSCKQAVARLGTAMIDEGYAGTPSTSLRETLGRAFLHGSGEAHQESGLPPCGSSVQYLANKSIRTTSSGVLGSQPAGIVRGDKAVRVAARGHHRSPFIGRSAMSYVAVTDVRDESSRSTMRANSARVSRDIIA